MCESYSRSLLRVSVAQICQALGWDSVQLSACHLLTDVLQRYLQQLGRGCHRYSELYGRTDPILDDVGEAFQLMGVSLHELEDYIHNIEPVTFPHQIPSFPVSKNNVLQFPQPGSKDAEERKEYIPDYMPPIVSSQEEEEEEQVPTDGGTSAEAMQVPLEADDELEEEEIINDENFLGKRPLDSPEAEEMPVVKRPRLLNAKGDALDAVLSEAREPLSSINTQKIPPLLSPVHVQDSSDPAPASPEPPMLAPVAKSQLPAAKPLETKSFTPKAKTKTTSPGQKSKSPKTPQAPAMVGSPIRSPKTMSKEKKSPGRSKSPRSPKSPKAVSHVPQTPVRPETPNRTLSATAGEKMSKEAPAVTHVHIPPDPGKLSTENPPKKAPVTDKTIDDSIDAVIARACAEREPDPFEFSSGSESEGDMFTSPKRISGPECMTPKAAPANTFTKAGATPLPLASGTSSSDNSWTMDASIDEVVRKAKMGTAPGVPPSFPYLSSPSISPPTPEPLHKLYEERAKPPSSADVKKKLKKELKTKMKKKEKQRDRERERDKGKDRSKEKEKGKEKEKDKEASKETKSPWKELLREDESDPYKFKIREFEDVDSKVRLKDGLVRKDKEKHKDKKKDREKGKKEKEKRDRDKVKEKGREDKGKAPPAPLVLPPKDVALPLFSPVPAARGPALLPSLSPMLPEKLFEEKEKPKDKERKKDKKEKKKKKEKEKEKEKKEKEREKEKREREKREREKEKHKHEKIKVEPAVPAPSPVIPRLTLRVGAGQDKIVISKVVPAPEPKAAPSLNRPKTPPPAPATAPVPVHVTPPPVPLPLLTQSTVSPALMASPSPAISGAGSSKAPVRSVVTETVSTYVIRDEWGNQIWICPGCDKPDDGSPMIGCDDCDDWYHW
ncbi:transcription initiation factor TFIID subunit 3 [Pteropus vampyrus]|uniref:Transcription initiation factor TFIID subunit 3 n=1 Tax=Pteropus vampyrus TaxID=132908 RepID=A0A6P3Q6S5_PTEVA|nr:transcription initiation factor TFIID subunit 3 [Pteropus vampyrus]